MLASAGPVPRTAVLLVATLLLQVGVVPYLAIDGYVADLLLMVAAVAGLVGGERYGMTIGCAAGVCMDLIVHTPFGMWMLCGTLLGAGCGRLSRHVTDVGTVTRALIAAFAVATGLALFVVLAYLLGLTYVTDRSIAPIMGIVFASTCLLAPLAHRSIRWALAMAPEPTVAS